MKKYAMYWIEQGHAITTTLLHEMQDAPLEHYRRQHHGEGNRLTKWVFIHETVRRYGEGTPTLGQAEEPFKR